MERTGGDEVEQRRQKRLLFVAVGHGPCPPVDAQDGAVAQQDLVGGQRRDGTGGEPNILLYKPAIKYMYKEN